MNAFKIKLNMIMKNLNNDEPNTKTLKNLEFILNSKASNNMNKNNVNERIRHFEEKNEMFKNLSLNNKKTIIKLVDAYNLLNNVEQKQMKKYIKSIT